MRCDAPAFSQRGAALILMMFILGMAALAYTVKSMNAASMQLAQDAETMDALGQAKEALIAWSVAHKNWPGIMPFPDRLEATSPNYDGKSDCVTNGLNNSHLIGKLPLLGDSPCISPQDGLGVEAVDSSGERFWYAVSKNLIRTSGSASTPVINPSITDSQWLRVFDSKGRLISGRVAVVIIAPGAPLEGQDRSSGISPISAYLDNLTVNGEVYSNRDYDQDDEDFIIGDTTTTSFNDRLVFITIDELMYALEKRVAQEAKQQLKSYYLASSAIPANRYYPYAAEIGDNNHVCKQGEFSGFLPIQAAAATCASNQACVVSFPMTEVQFSSVTPVSYSAREGYCSYSGNTCTCTGAGSCSRVTPSKTFLCAADGGCSSSEAGDFTFNYIQNSPDGTILFGDCVGGNGSVACNGVGDFRSAPISDCTHTNAGLENLPEWFLRNRWQDYIYYAVANDCSVAGSGCLSADLRVGGKSNVHAIVIMTGQKLLATEDRPFTPQSHPSSNIRDYLDSVENVNDDILYDGIYKPRTSTYNDQTFVVAP